MFKKKTGVIVAAILALLFQGQSASGASDNANPVLEEILAGVEKRYQADGFSAKFNQVSTLKALQIRDSAAGRAYFRKPGKMHWAYDQPEQQMIITDSRNLWIFRPGDNQVMIGEAPQFFSDGKGASFLADVGQIRNRFDISLETGEAPDCFSLQLVPKEQNLDLSWIRLDVSRATHDILRVVSRNAYDDETVIEFSEIRFDPAPEDSYFEFSIPDGVEVLEIDQ